MLSAQAGKRDDGVLSLNRCPMNVSLLKLARRLALECFDGEEEQARPRLFIANPVLASWM